MLFVAFVAYALSSHLRVGVHAMTSMELDPREESTGPCNDIHNCRTLFDIVWGCLATGFAATWVSVHPDVPAPGQSWLRLAFRRLWMMLIGLIGPEITVYFAARQFIAARKFSKEFGVSQTHGFFFSMGGFVSRMGNHPITTMEQLQDPLVGEEYLRDIKSVEADDIMDKSKGDVVSKGIALLQCFWFILQCLVRAAQHLPITEIEYSIFAFAVVNILTWLLWWNKPLEVQRAILIGPVTRQGNIDPATFAPEVSTQLAYESLFSGPLYGTYIHYHPAEGVAVPSFWSSSNIYSHTFIWIEAGVATIFGAIHCAAWKADFPSKTEMRLWKVCSLLITTVPIGIQVADFIGSSSPGWFERRVLYAIFMGGYSIYLACRIILIILPFTTLRSLPSGAFAQVDFTIYIPHL